MLLTLAVAPARAALDQRPHQVADRLHLLEARALIGVVMDGDEPQPRSREGDVSDQRLTLEPGQSVESALVEQLGREVADRGVQAPRLAQEQSTIRGNGLSLAEHVIERRDLGALGM